MLRLSAPICGFTHSEYKMNILTSFHKLYFSPDIWLYTCSCYFNNNLFFNPKTFTLLFFVLLWMSNICFMIIQLIILEDEKVLTMKSFVWFLFCYSMLFMHKTQSYCLFKHYTFSVNNLQSYLQSLVVNCFFTKRYIICWTCHVHQKRRYEVLLKIPYTFGTCIWNFFLSY